MVCMCPLDNFIVAYRHAINVEERVHDDTKVYRCRVCNKTYEADVFETARPLKTRMTLDVGRAGDIYQFDTVITICDVIRIGRKRYIVLGHGKTNAFLVPYTRAEYLEGPFRAKSYSAKYIGNIHDINTNPAVVELAPYY